MSGHWTHREADIHKCQKPEFDGTVKRFDRWQCDECGTEWIVTVVEYDQKDRCYWGVMVNYESWKSGPFPPGTK